MIQLPTSPRRLVPFLAVAAFLAVGKAAQAQDDPRALANRLDRIERDMVMMQRQLYAGRAVPQGGAVGEAPPMVVGPASGQLGGLQVKLGEMEQMMRSMTGQLERLQYENRQLRETVDRELADLKLRVQDMEQQLGPAAPMAGGDVSAAGAAVAVPPAPGEGLRLDGSTAAAVARAARQEPVPQRPGQLPQGTLGTMTTTAPASSGGSLLVPPPAGAAPGTQTALAQPGGGEADARSLYDQALGAMRRSQFTEAQLQLDEFVKRHGDHPLAGNAHYWLGETHYVQGQFQQAAESFVLGYSKYPKGQKAPDNLLKLGMSLGRLGRADQACQALARLQAEFPNASGEVRGRATAEAQALNCR